MKNENLHIITPIIQSGILSDGIKGNVWLKMEALQPSGSFKLRGIGHACRIYKDKGAKKFIGSSGGNAGIAVAFSGRKLDVPVTVVVPQSTPVRAIDLIKQNKAQVIVEGKTWQEAHEHAMKLMDDDTYYLHPFDNPLLWEGHATIIDEVKQAGITPDVVILSVGGGGLFCGVIEGLQRNGWNHVPVVAVETAGADSLAQSINANRNIELDNITSIATSLGAKKVAEKAFLNSISHKVLNHVVTDREALNACFRFSNDHRILVEPACGASLSVVYSPIDFLLDKKNILVIVCGGAGVSIEQLKEWDEKLTR
jgi:L-serine/L-threonine ammonia-lyase